MSKLSPTQNDCVEAAKASNGVLQRYPGGFWSAPGVEMKTMMGKNIPAWHFGTNTIRALLKNEVFEVMEEKQGARGSFPVAIRLKTQSSE